MESTPMLSQPPIQLVHSSDDICEAFKALWAALWHGKLGKPSGGQSQGKCWEAQT